MDQFPSDFPPVKGVILLLFFAGCAGVREPREFSSIHRKAIKDKPRFFSVQGREIKYTIIGNGEVNVHFHAAIHGDEPEGVGLLKRLIAYVGPRNYLTRGLRIIFVPVVNPDGLAKGSRLNARGVDLNRNFPARNWKMLANGRSGKRPLSEPETKAIARLVELYPPSLVVSLHAARRSVNWDGPCRDLAQEMAIWNGYKPEASVGYPTPGSLGSWLGKDKGIPVITLELRRGNPDELWEENRFALVQAIEWVRKKACPGLRKRPY